MPLHPLEDASQLHSAPVIIPTPSITPSASHLHQATTPLSYVDVYMDDFIGVSQPPTSTATLRAILWSIHQVFRGTPHPNDGPARKPVISTSKLENGNGQWSTQKNILGWLIDTMEGSVRLLPHKALRLQELIEQYLPVRRTSRRQWYKLLGELRHMATAIPGAKYLFSLLQHVLVDQPTSSRLRLSHLVRASLQDWISLAQSLSSTPTPTRSLVPAPPEYIGSVDASGSGLGGFWVSTSDPEKPAIVFRSRFPASISQQLVSASNTTGRLTNSDFELAALIMGSAVLASTQPLNHSHIWCGSDNTPAVAWCSRGSNSSKAPSAFLLRWLASLTRQHSFVLRPVSVPGKSNTIADFCSHSFHLNDQVFLHQLTELFPTRGGWLLVHPTKQTVSAMISAMSCEMSPWASPAHGLALPTPPGQSGRTSAPHWGSTRLHSMSPTQLPFSKCSHTDIGVANYLPAALKSEVEQWETPFEPLGRRSPTWDTLIPA